MEEMKREKQKDNDYDDDDDDDDDEGELTSLSSLMAKERIQIIISSCAKLIFLWLEF